MSIFIINKYNYFSSKILKKKILIIIKNIFIKYIKLINILENIRFKFVI